MKIYYSPYFGCKPYIDIADDSVNLGSKYANTAELLSQLELRLGMSYSDSDISNERLAEYHEILDQVIQTGHMLRQSFQIDEEIDIDNDEKKYSVTSAILSWRDTLILAGWNCKTDLKGAKLEIVSSAEKHIPATSVIRNGMADRWKALLDADLTLAPEDIDIEVLCPSILIEPIVRKVLDRLGAKYTYDETSQIELDSAKAQVIEAADITDAYKWLAYRQPQTGEVIACAETERIDCVLRSLHKPMAGEAEVGCHQIISDPRDFVDSPKSLVWLDCYGDYGLRYPYDFMSPEEIAHFNSILSDGCRIPAKQDMLSAVQQYLYASLNKVTDSVVYVSAKRDTGTLLPEHPVVTWLKYKGVKTVDAESQYTVEMTPETDEIRFVRKPEYKVDGFDTSKVMSYSTLDEILQTPFDFAIEYEAGMRDAAGTDDIKTVIGNVAHEVIELMVNGDEGEKGKGQGLRLSDFDAVFKRAIELKDEEKLLSQTENTFVLQEFEHTLRQSIQTLMEIISENSLQIVASEMKIPSEESDIKGEEIPGIGLVKGTIDLVLKNNKNEYFIFDFKYSTSHRHADKLAQCRSIQFELYRRLFDQHSGIGKIKAMGYYLFPLATLYMSEDDYNQSGLRSEHIQSIPVDKKHQEDTWNAIIRSYEFRKGQFRSGTIEEGEGMEIESLAYGRETNLFQLEHEYQKDTLKSSGYSPKHIVLKNQIR